MATYVNNLRLKEIATGDEEGTWGASTNTNLELIADAFGSGITAAFWFIIAALLVPKEYGEIQYFISIAGIAYTISLLLVETPLRLPFIQVMQL